MDLNTQYLQCTDLSALEKQQLIFVLQEMQKIFSILNDKLNAVRDAKKKAVQEEQKAKDMEYLFLQKQRKSSIAIGAAVAYIAWQVGELFLITSLIIGVIVLFISFAIIVSFEQKMDDNPKLLAEQHRKNYVIPAQEKQKELEADLAQYIQSPEILWAKSVLYEKYLDFEIINQLIEYLKSGRADNLKEALNLYEEVTHRERMETMQASILTAAQQTAAESAITAQAALRSAEANEAAAAEAKKISQAANAAADEAKKIRQASNVTAAASAMAAHDIHKMANKR